MTHCAPLETHGFPTLTPLAAFLYGKTVVFPTPFERFAPITRTESSISKNSSLPARGGSAFPPEEDSPSEEAEKLKALPAGRQGHKMNQIESVTFIRDSHNSFREFCRIISTPWLKGLLPFHRAPINVVISHDP